MSKFTLTPARRIRFTVPLVVAGAIVLTGGSIAAAAGVSSPAPAPVAHAASVSVDANGKTVSSGDFARGAITIDLKNIVQGPASDTGTTVITKSVPVGANDGSAGSSTGSVSIDGNGKTVATSNGKSIADVAPASTVGKVTEVAGPAGGGTVTFTQTAIAGK